MSSQITSKPNFPAAWVIQGSITRFCNATRTKSPPRSFFRSLLLVTVFLFSRILLRLADSAVELPQDQQILRKFGNPVNSEIECESELRNPAAVGDRAHLDLINPNRASFDQTKRLGAR